MLPFRRLAPLMNRILVKKVEPITKTKSGILLPDNGSEQLNYATIVQAGPGKTDSKGKHTPMLVKEGDTVLLPEYGGHKITLGDEKEYFLYRDDDILGVLSDKQ